MPIMLNEPTVGERIPVLKRRALGQSFTGALILTDQRDSQKKNDLTGAMEPVLKPNGKARQELIVRLVTITSTMPAGIGDDEDVPTAGAIVRIILKGGGFSQWIDANKALPSRQVGDIIDITSTNAVLYSGDGTAGTKTTDQAAIDAWRTKGRQVGIYGDLTIRRATPAETAWVTAAETAYHAARTPIALEDGDMFSD